MNRDEDKRPLEVKPISDKFEENDEIYKRKLEKLEREIEELKKVCTSVIYYLILIKSIT